MFRAHVEINTHPVFPPPPPKIAWRMIVEIVVVLGIVKFLPLFISIMFAPLIEIDILHISDLAT